MYTDRAFFLMKIEEKNNKFIDFFNQMILRENVKF